MEHEKFMKMAILEAKKALLTDDVPIGCVAVAGGNVIAKARNEKEKRGDATGHAELLCLQKTAKKLGTWRLSGVTLYSTLEPCPMCAGAMVLARVNCLVYGADEPKFGAVKSKFKLLKGNRLNHKVPVVSGILKDESSSLLKTFFKKKR